MKPSMLGTASALLYSVLVTGLDAADMITSGPQGFAVRNTTRTSVNVSRHFDPGAGGHIELETDSARERNAVAAAASVVAASTAVGSVARSTPPKCVPVVVKGITYQQCGATWYQPQYAGTTVQYVVVNPPQ